MLMYLFTDIETHRVKEFNEISESLRKAWINHYHGKYDYENPEDSYKEYAALYPEFSHVICVSLGYEGEDGTFRKITFKGKNEVQDVLLPLKNALAGCKKSGYSTCGWNTAGFDIPYLIKRYIINGIEVPEMINEYGIKPWERSNYDLMQDWKCGSSNYTSLEAAAASLGIPCKSESISGRNMYLINIDDMDWDELGLYCEEDIEVTYKIYRIMEKYYFPSE